jgi:hypothetical protein
MPLTATQLLHAYCGSPAVAACHDLPAGSECRVCGGPAIRGMDAQRWEPTWLMQGKIRAQTSSYACEGCIYVASRSSPVPGKPPAPGKSEGPRFSNLSHLYEQRADGSVWYRAASKGEKPAIREFLQRPKPGMWFAAIADTGQKHVLPWTPINPVGVTRGRLLFEETSVTLPASLALVDDMAALLTAGATKDDIARGDYSTFAWLRCEREIREFEAAHASERASSWWSLALWLAQRDEEAVQARVEDEKAARAAARSERGTKPRGAGATDRRNRAGSRRRAARVSEDAGCVGAQALGPDPGPRANGGAHQRQRRGVANEPVAEPQAAGAGQISLGFDA